MHRSLASTTARRIRLFACLALLATLAACGTSHPYRSAIQRNPTRYYPPPGPASDPWGPYIHEASARFAVPEPWVRGVMHQESGGQEDVISAAGAMGLMQVMPDTYDGLRQRYNLGDDPFDPHNNILAGTAYLREMYDRFGSPGFLAAYNAGPNRLDKYLTQGTPLPTETVNYVAAIAPRLGSDRPMSGPLAMYGGARAIQVAARPTPADCDPDAAYNPDGPCVKLRPPVAATAVAYNTPDCDPDAAYDPSRPCHMPAAIAPQQQFASESRRPLQERLSRQIAFHPAAPSGPPPGRWMIQVGAFANLSTAEAAAKRARSAAPDLLDQAKIELPATVPFGNQVAFRARLSGLTAQAAAQACGRLTGHGIACLTVPPPRDSF